MPSFLSSSKSSLINSKKQTSALCFKDKEKNEDSHFSKNTEKYLTKNSKLGNEESGITANWVDETGEEGELLLDIFKDNNGNIVVKSTIAGVKPEDIDISINGDMLTIRGKRHKDESISEKNYFYKECYWGSFSRTVILPVEIRTDKVKANLKNGVLTIHLPPLKKEKSANIKVKGED